jgi:hypothetical protein
METCETMVQNKVQEPPSARTRQDRPTTGVAWVMRVALAPRAASPTGEEINILTEKFWFSARIKL